MQLTFVVAGEPKPQPRPKAARIGGFIRIYTPKTAEEWKKAVKIAARKATAGQLSGPLRLSLRFYFARPKAHLKSDGSLRPAAPLHHTKRPDVDNLAKAVMDALTDCGLWADDSAVVSLETSKHYAQSGSRSGCGISITPFA